MAKNDAALRHLSSGITVDVVDVSSEDSGGTNPAFASSAMDACLHSGRDASHVYVVSRGSLSVWRREHTQRARPGRPRSSDRAPQRAASKRKEPRTGGNTEQEGAKGVEILGSLSKRWFSNRFVGDGHTGATKWRFSISASLSGARRCTCFPFPYSLMTFQDFVIFRPD